MGLKTEIGYTRATHMFDLGKLSFNFLFHHQTFEKCIVVVAICSGMGATNFNFLVCRQ